MLTHFRATLAAPASAAPAGGLVSSEAHPDLAPHGFQWERVDQVTEDALASQVAPRAHLINHLLTPDSNALDYFRTFFGEDFLREIVSATNAAPELNSAPIDKQELLCFLGLHLAMSLQRLPDRRSYWETEGNDLFPSPNFGRFMPRNRFESILRCFQLGIFTPAELQV